MVIQNLKRKTPATKTSAGVRRSFNGGRKTAESFRTYIKGRVSGSIILNFTL